MYVNLLNVYTMYSYSMYIFRNMVIVYTQYKHTFIYVMYTTFTPLWCASNGSYWLSSLVEPHMDQRFLLIWRSPHTSSDRNESVKGISLPRIDGGGISLPPDTAIPFESVWQLVSHSPATRTDREESGANLR